ncbi:DUF4305 domain-containing protein [Virgibacillus oceani]
MKISPLTMAIIYFLLGLFFIYVATLSAEEGTIWNVTTTILALFATLNIGVGIRLMALYIRMKNSKK